MKGRILSLRWQEFLSDSELVEVQDPGARGGQTQGRPSSSGLLWALQAQGGGGSVAYISILRGNLEIS